MRTLTRLFIGIAYLLSTLMPVAVCIKYHDMLYDIVYMGYSAPAYVAFLTAISFVIGIVACVILANICYKRIQD